MAAQWWQPSVFAAHILCNSPMQVLLFRFQYEIGIHILCDNIKYIINNEPENI
jgi:hypothetical protein